MKKISVLFALLMFIPQEIKPCLDGAFDDVNTGLVACAAVLVAGGAAGGIIIYRCLYRCFYSSDYCSCCGKSFKEGVQYCLVESCGHRFHCGCARLEMNCDACKEAIEKLPVRKSVEFNVRHHPNC